jgi:tRNA pseudouridine13 synthase
MTTDDLPYAHGGPPLRGTMRATPEDFIVDEDLGFAADGAGEHAFVRVEKRGANTEWVARQLARYAGVDANAVSYAGMKDRNALTRQTFSVHLPGKPDPDWSALEHDEFRVLDARRHRRKLQRGALKGNAFRIVLRDVSGDVAAVEQRLDAIRRFGVPNYFGEQRFGRDGDNIERARAMFGGKRVQRHECSILLSAARSHLFNQVLAARVREGSWNQPLDGDVWMLDGSQSIFGPQPLTDALRERNASGDIAPTGPLWGAGELRSESSAAALERAIGENDEDLVRGLVANGLRQERRALVLRLDALRLERISSCDISVIFSLNKGSYATVLLREIIESNDPGQQ